MTDRRPEPGTSPERLAGAIPSPGPVAPAEPLCSAKSEAGELVLLPDRLTFRGSPVRARLGRGVEDREILLRRIVAVVLRQASFWRMGSLDIELADPDASQDEPRVVKFLFQKWERQPFDELAAQLQRQIEVVRLAPAEDESTLSGPKAGAAADLTDQIRKLGGLRDDGLLTVEEFEAKKRDLLSRL